MEKFQSLGRSLSKAEQKKIIGAGRGPGSLNPNCSNITCCTAYNPGPPYYCYNSRCNRTEYCPTMEDKE